MIRKAVAILALVCAALVCATGAPACGGGQKTGRPGGSSGPIAAAARRIPKHATYALIFARADGATGMIRNLMTPFGAAEREITPSAVDAELRQDFGFSMIDPADLLDHGVDTSRPFAIFSTDYIPTLLVPVGDAGKVAGAISKLVGDNNALVRDHRGAHVTAILGRPGVAFALIDGWVAIHFSEEEAKEPASSLAWLDEILDAGDGVDPSWALAQAGARQDAVGWIDSRALLGKLSRGECKPPEVFGRAAIGATLTDGAIDAAAALELTPEAAQALARHTAAPPDGSFLGARDRAAVALSISADLAWLGGLARGLREPCGLLDDLVEDTEIDHLDNVQPGVTGAHVAILDARMAGEDLDVDALVWLGIGDEGAVRTWLDFLFPPEGRGHEQIAGIDVDTFKLEVLPLGDPLRFVLQPGVLRLTAGRGMMELLLGQASVKPDAATGKGTELGFFQLLPDAMPDTRPLSELLVVSGRFYEEDMRDIALFFASLKRLVLSAALDSGTLRLAGRFELR